MPDCRAPNSVTRRRTRADTRQILHAMHIDDTTCLTDPTLHDHNAEIETSHHDGHQSATSHIHHHHRKTASPHHNISTSSHHSINAPHHHATTSPHHITA